MSHREEIREYFTFSKSQQRGILTLLALIIVCSLLWFYLGRMMPSRITASDDELKQLIDALVIDSNGKGNEGKVAIRLTPFPFDPNTLDEAGFKRLGLRDRLVKTLLNYRNKGGKFYSKESLQRIYGLHEDEYRQLEPFIRLPDQVGNPAWTKKEMTSIEINSADTTQWIGLPWIGSRLASNIVAYRERLGGFCRPEQLLEVFGITPESYARFRPYLRVDRKRIRTLNLNTATYYELNAHPYLHGALADSLAALRRRHQYKLDNLQQLREIALINDEIFRKIAAYLHTD